MRALLLALLLVACIDVDAETFDPDALTEQLCGWVPKLVATVPNDSCYLYTPGRDTAVAPIGLLDACSVAEWAHPHIFEPGQELVLWARVGSSGDLPPSKRVAVECP